MIEGDWVPDNLHEYVYMMTTPCLPGWVKIGRTNDPERRRRELSTAVPKPFYLQALWSTPESRKVESLFHAALNQWRVPSGAEFFLVQRILTLEEDELGVIVGHNDTMENFIEFLNGQLNASGLQAYQWHVEQAAEVSDLVQVQRIQVNV
ncbi:GIY-YIG nuclease family protein [Alcaligenes faecalis]|uniref:GIY-YIG nuclease family protein n=1 Tax=Alcaligenes faecalis TaxID=511 RepID=A0AAE9H9R7_ALCFA|nr:GIY-YIG nuclease family protein [Alcaligenes faecalis]UPL20231.1 GIY-YIG nuclease family protein [Alcaligenes faecalis]